VVRAFTWCWAYCLGMLGLLFVPAHVAVAQASAVAPVSSGVSHSLGDGETAVPPLNAHVTDLTATLSAPQREALIVGTTGAETIEQYGYRVASTWKIGRKDIGDGLLIVVAKNDRTIRIEVARALEGAVPDLAAYRIIDRVITPAFKQGDFAGGLNQGADHLMARIKGENLPLPEPSSAQPGPKFDFFQLLTFGFIAIPIVSAVLGAIFGRKTGALITGGLFGFLAWLALSSLVFAAILTLIAFVLALARFDSWGSGTGGRGGSGGGWSSGGGGGGWSSGGGGSFGGGGASGKW
jgi:uncharacterized protein